MTHSKPESVEPTLHSLLATYREAARTERDKGTYFERFAVAYLTRDPVQRDLYENVLTFKDWATEYGWDGRDIGIDLVGKLRDEDGFPAIQCKLRTMPTSMRLRRPVTLPTHLSCCSA